MTTRKRVVVSGEVQGVFFRDTCRREADARGVAGWARNRADGAVEAVFEGEPASVEAMVAWCNQGPPMARVASVDVTDDELPEGLSGFRIS